MSVEHKLGHTASPTCVLSFGENNECFGELIGEQHNGLKAMFTMMNNARLNVGIQGVAIAERAIKKHYLLLEIENKGFLLKKVKKKV